MAQPPAITPARRAKLIAALRSGLPITTACKLSRVSTSAYYRALARADDPTAPRIFAKFREEAEEARALAEADLVAEVKVAARGDDWRAAAWLLSHGHRDEWGDKTRVEVGGEGSVLIMLHGLEAKMGLTDPDADV
jgi:hypothetical protein